MYIAQKPCKFQGKEFKIGDTIEESLVLPGAVKRLTKEGIIAVAGGNPPAALEEVVAEVGQVKFEVTIHSAEEDIKIPVCEEILNILTEIRQTGTNKKEDQQKIVSLIQKVETEKALIFIDAMDGRKFVQEEAQKRAEELNETE